MPAWKNLMGAAALVAATGYLVRSFPSAQADVGPGAIAYGAHPFVYFSGEAVNSETVLTVGAGETFLLRVLSGSAQCKAYLDGNLLAAGAPIETGALAVGSAHLKIEEGSTLSIAGYNVYNPCYYYIEGYYAQ
jgi:hypothetical protein